MRAPIRVNSCWSRPKSFDSSRTACHALTHWGTEMSVPPRRSAAVQEAHRPNSACRRDPGVFRGRRAAIRAGSPVRAETVNRGGTPHAERLAQARHHQSVCYDLDGRAHRRERAGARALEDGERVRQPVAAPRHFGRAILQGHRAAVRGSIRDEVLRARGAGSRARVLRCGVEGFGGGVLDDAGLSHRQVPGARVLHHGAVRARTSASSWPGNGSAAATSCATRSTPSTT